MMDAHICPVCGQDGDYCYCPGVPLTSPAERRETAPRAASPRPAVPPPATGGKGEEWPTPLHMVPVQSGDGTPLACPLCAAWLFHADASPPDRFICSACRQGWQVAVCYIPAAYPLDPGTGRVTVGTAKAGTA